LRHLESAKGSNDGGTAWHRPDDHPNVTGGIGVIGTRPTQDAMEGCDGLLVVGSSMPYIEFWPSPGQAACVQIDDRPERIGLRYPADIGLVGDAKATLAALIPFLERNRERAFLEQAQQGIREWWRLMEQRGTRTETPMKPQVVAWELAQALPDDAIVCGDSGQVTYLRHPVCVCARASSSSAVRAPIA
jgi:pyruvate dehydrogenase (quinone)